MRLSYHLFKFKLLGFKDLIKINELIICINLKFTNRKEHNKYPSLLATNLSLFTAKVSKFKFMQTVFDQYLAFSSHNSVINFLSFFLKLNTESFAF